MATLGSYGEEKPAEENTFGWFGQELRVNPMAGEQAYIDFFEVVGELDERDPRAAVEVKKFLREIVHADDFDEFWRIGREKRQNTEDLFKIAQSIIEALSGHPTEQSSDSSPGLSGTVPSSTAASYSQIRRELEESGRPELALVYLEAEEAGVAS